MDDICGNAHSFCFSLRKLHFSTASLLYRAVESSVMVIIVLKIRSGCNISAVYLGKYLREHAEKCEMRGVSIDTTSIIL